MQSAVTGKAPPTIPSVFDEPQSLGYFIVNSNWLLAHRAQDGSYAVEQPTRWQTLNDFVKFWDGVHSGEDSFLPFTIETGNATLDCRSIKRVDEEESKHLSPNRGPYDSLNQLSYKIGRKSPSTWSIGTDVVMNTQFTSPFGGMLPPTPVTRCSFPTVLVNSISPNFSAAFSPLAAQANKWGNGKSSNEFSDLLASSKYLEETPLPALSKALRQRANTDTERVELFQAKLPASAVPTYGSIILVVCQFYLLGHLWELHRTLSSGTVEVWPSGYIGLYPNRSMVFFAIASLSIFPLLPLVLAAVHNEGKLRYLSVAICLASAVIGILSSQALIATDRLRENFDESSEHSDNKKNLISEGEAE